VLIHAGWQYILRNSAATGKCDAVPCNVQEQIVWLNNDILQALRLLIGDEGEPRGIKMPVEDVLTSYKGEAQTLRQIVLGPSARCSARANLEGNIGEPNNRPFIRMRDWGRACRGSACQIYENGSIQPFGLHPFHCLSLLAFAHYSFSLSCERAWVWVLPVS